MLTKNHWYLIIGVCVFISFVLGAMAVGGVFDKKKEDAIPDNLILSVKGATGKEKITLSVDSSDLLVDQPLTKEEEVFSFSINPTSKILSINFKEDNGDVLIQNLLFNGKEMRPNFILDDHFSKDNYNKVTDIENLGGLYWKGIYRFDLQK